MSSEVRQEPVDGPALGDPEAVTRRADDAVGGGGPGRDPGHGLARPDVAVRVDRAVDRPGPEAAEGVEGECGVVRRAGGVDPGQVVGEVVGLGQESRALELLVQPPCPITISSPSKTSVRPTTDQKTRNHAPIRARSPNGLPVSQW